MNYLPSKFTFTLNESKFSNPGVLVTCTGEGGGGGGGVGAVPGRHLDNPGVLAHM